MKVKEITAIVRYYDTEMCNLQNERNAAYVKFDKLEQSYNLALEEAETLRERSAYLSKFADMSTEEVYNWLETVEGKAADFDRLLTRYAGLEQLHEAAIAGFKSDIEILQSELDVAKMEAKSAKQAGVFLKHALDSATSSLACVTVDAVAHCSGENEEALRAFIGLVQEHVTLSIQNRVDLDAMLSNLDHDF